MIHQKSGDHGIVQLITSATALILETTTPFQKLDYQKTKFSNYPEDESQDRGSELRLVHRLF